MRNLRLAAALSVALMTSAVAVAQDAAPRIDFSIAEQPLGSALTAFAKQARVQILSRDEDVLIAGKRASAISGELAVREALELLLANTGLSYEFVNARTVRITADAPSRRPTSDARSSGERLRLAQAQAPEAARAASVDSAERSREVGIEEVVVTAQKRLERLQDVPIPVTAVDAQLLLKGNQLRVQDYYSKVPGLNYSPGNGASRESRSAASLRTPTRTRPSAW